MQIEYSFSPLDMLFDKTYELDNGENSYHMNCMHFNTDVLDISVSICCNCVVNNDK